MTCPGAVVGGVWGAGVLGAGGVFGFGGCGGVVPGRLGVLWGSFLGVFECCCMSEAFGFRAPLVSRP